MRSKKEKKGTMDKNGTKSRENKKGNNKNAREG